MSSDEDTSQPSSGNIDADMEKDAVEGIEDDNDDQLKAVKSAYPAESESGTLILGDNSKSSSKKLASANSSSMGDSEVVPFSDLNDIEFLDMMYQEEEKARHLAIENEVFTLFLKENDPFSMEEIENLYAVALNLKSQVSQRSSTIKESQSSLTMRASSAYMTAGKSRSENASSASILQMIAAKGPKINLNTTTEMCVRAIEDKEAAMEAFRKKTHLTRRRLKCELEEFAMRQSDISDSMALFEFNIVTHAVDPLTQRIPAEKFLNYMSASLKDSMQSIEKLRLRSSTMRLQYSKVSALLLQRQELRINVQAVDFDRLEIENKHFQKKIEQKNDHLFQLKKMSAGVNLVITQHRKYMQNQFEHFSKVRDDIKRIEKYTEDIYRGTEQVEKDLEKAEEQYEYFKALQKCYRVPDVMDYVKLKDELREVHKNIKIWERKKYIQDLAMDAALREMKHLTGSKTVSKRWLRDPDEVPGFNINATASMPDFTTLCLRPVFD